MKKRSRSVWISGKAIGSGRKNYCYLSDPTNFPNYSKLQNFMACL